MAKQLKQNPDDDIIIQEIELARKHLLDLSRRNRMINYRVSKRRTVMIINPDLQGVFDGLVKEERIISFKSDNPKDDESYTKPIVLPWPTNSKTSTKVKQLIAPMTQEQLQSKLHEVSKQSKSFFEEQGYSILYMALGMVKWKTSKSAIETSRAPLLLVPVELRRSSIGAPYKLFWTGDEVASNICLIEKAKELNLKLPEFPIDDKDDNQLDSYFSKIITVTKKANWELENYACLDFFRFSKLVMWKDLDFEVWQHRSNTKQKKLFQKLLLPISISHNRIEEISDYKKELNIYKTYHILNADPSQIAVIEAVKAGRDIVVEGPPGTGKSQTIANLIAELMAMNKKVLFVSEKMAALEVVKSRLDYSGLGSFCLELHSRKTNKKQFLNNLGQAWNHVIEETYHNKSLYHKLDKTRDLLNKYANSLQRRIGKRGMSLHQLISSKETALTHFDHKGRAYRPCKITKAGSITNDEWNVIVDELANLAQHAEDIDFTIRNPWRGTNPRFSTNQEIDCFIEECYSAHKMWAKLYGVLDKAVNLFALPFSGLIEDIGYTIKNLNLIMRFCVYGPKSIMNPLWDTIEPIRIINSIKRFKGTIDHDDRISKLDCESLSKLYTTYCGKLMAIRRIQHSISLLSKICHISDTYRLDNHVHFNNLVLFILESSAFNCSEAIDSLSSNPQILDEISDALHSFKKKHDQALKYVKQDALDEASELQINSFLSIWKSKKRHFNKNYRATKKKFRVWFQDSYSDQTQSSVRDAMESMIAYYEGLQTLLEYKNIASSIIGSSWENEKTDINIVENIRKWFKNLHLYTNDGSIDTDIYSSLRDGLDYKHLENLQHSYFTSIKDVSKHAASISDSSNQDTKKFILPVTASKYLDKLKYIRVMIYKDSALSLFGTLWKSIYTNPAILEKTYCDMLEIRTLLHNGKVSADTIDRINDWRSDPNSFDSVLEAFAEWDHINSYTNDLLEKLGDTSYCFKNTVRGRVEDFIKVLQEWSSSSADLETWTEYCISKSQCKSMISKSIIDSFESGAIANADDILPSFEASYVDQLLVNRISNDPLLSGFKSQLHNNKVKMFIDLDKAVVNSNPIRLKAMLNERKPSLISNASNSSEVGFLLGELNKKRAHKPIRQILKRCGNIVQELKPCFMMSPLSIAQFLDPGSILFDTIIFDEASQVRPEDALGSLLRGNQLVVLGDSKQLPPTSFFDHLTEIDEDLLNQDDDVSSASISEIESILQQCLTKLPRKLLNWHYRSRHESLIIGSNSLFYDNSLQVFPSPFLKSQDIGLHFEYRPDTVYERGSGAVNRLEAAYVVDLAIEHLINKPEWSLGIGAFSARQQNVIIDEFETRIRIRHDLQELVDPERHEHFFVKNLETIQGDERDVIIISTGYGFDNDGKLSMLFGPINNEGGHRRLNVLMTRARYKCVIVANFQAKDLKVKSTSSLGLKALQSYLLYAETGRIVTNDDNSSFYSEFVDSIYDYLTGNGYTVKKHVGCAGHRVDLAVCHTSDTNNYAIGIVCDGISYYNAATARERDRLRREVLEDLGWTVYNVWSVDWYKRRMSCKENLLKVVKQATSRPVHEKRKQLLPSKTPKALKTKVNTKQAKPLPLKQNDEIKIDDYVFCSNRNLYAIWNGYDSSERTLNQALADIIITESPIHIEDVVDRICKSGAYSKPSNRNNVFFACLKVTYDDKIRFDGSYLFNLKKEILPRRRTPPIRLERICDKEIIALVKLILEKQLSTEINDLCIQVARFLGIRRLLENNKAIIQQIISDMAKSGIIKISKESIVTLV